MELEFKSKEAGFCFSGNFVVFLEFLGYFQVERGGIQPIHLELCLRRVIKDDVREFPSMEWKMGTKEENEQDWFFGVSSTDGRVNWQGGRRWTGG